MVQVDYSHECDKEVVSRAVWRDNHQHFTDISSEKDILEMVFALTGFKDLAKKPLCPSPKGLVQQLNEMIRRDTRTKKANNH